MNLSRLTLLICLAGLSVCSSPLSAVEAEGGNAEDRNAEDGNVEGANADAELERLLRQVMAERMAEVEAVEPVPQVIPDGALPPAVPGRGDPAAPVTAQAWEIDWDDYRTLVVVEPGESKRRRVWVATRKNEDGELAVAYTGTAFTDARGDVHIDCRHAVISGPMASNWSPDSFAIDAQGGVRVIDDYDRGNPGRVIAQAELILDPKEKSTTTLNYDTARALARWYVEGGL